MVEEGTGASVMIWSSCLVVEGVASVEVGAAATVVIVDVSTGAAEVAAVVEMYADVEIPVSAAVTVVVVAFVSMGDVVVKGWNSGTRFSSQTICC